MFERGDETFGETKSDRKAVKETIRTATQPSAWCQNMTQTMSKLPRELRRPYILIIAVMIMNMPRQSDKPKRNFWLSLIRTAQSNRTGIAMINTSVNMSRLMAMVVRMKGLRLRESIQHCAVIIKSVREHFSAGFVHLSSFRKRER